MSTPLDGSAWSSFTGRLPEALYRDAQDVALALDLSLNELLVDGIDSYVRSQLDKRVIATAVERMRTAREVTAPAGRPRPRARGGRAKSAKPRSPA